jgi:thymidylate synthase ThyX
VRAKACDALRGLLPAATLSNVGIYGTGQGYEALLLRMRSHPLPEARQYAQLMLTELRKVIPSFLRRVDRPDRGGAWSRYLEQTRDDTEAVVARLFGDLEPSEAAVPAVRLLDWDPEGEDKVLAAIAYPHSNLAEHRLLDHVARLGAADRRALFAAYVGDRGNRRHKPGRAFERTGYRFDICCDYGAFRDLQRHRMLTVEWQSLTPEHGYDLPAPVAEAGGADAYHEAMARSRDLHDLLRDDFPTQAQYAVALGYRIRFVLQLNAREAMHVLELRTSPQGHPSYRTVCQEMHRLIAEQAGHTALAEAMRHVDHGTTDGLERLDAERAAEARRLA